MVVIMNELSNDLLKNTSQLFNIRRFLYKKQTTMNEMHYHKHFEILYVFKNTRNLFINNKVYSLHKGNIAVIPPYVLHKTKCGGILPQERILINFKRKFFEEYSIFEKNIDCFSAETPVFELDKNQREKIASILYALSDNINHNDETEIKLQLLRILNILTVIGRFTPCVTNTKTQAIRNTVKYVANHYYENITLDSLEQKFMISKYELSRLFKNYAGKTMVKYLNSIRIMKAKELLLKKEFTVIKIATECGFENITHFNRVFKQSENMSPTEYVRLAGDNRNNL